jgi:hypothetical protein
MAEPSETAVAIQTERDCLREARWRKRMRRKYRQRERQAETRGRGFAALKRFDAKIKQGRVLSDTKATGAHP